MERRSEAMDGPTPGIQVRSVATFFVSVGIFSPVENDKPQGSGTNWKKRTVLFRWVFQLRWDVVTGIIEKHFDVLAAVGRCFAIETAFSNPLRQAVANLAPAGDFVFGHFANENG